MYKPILVIICIVSIGLLSSCASDAELTYGAYELVSESSDDLPKPSICISDKNMSFAFDALSSYLSIGNYVVDDNILTMTTNDDLYKYSFRIEGESLFFLMDESSDVELIDDRFGIPLEDNMEFRLSSD